MFIVEDEEEQILYTHTHTHTPHTHKHTHTLQKAKMFNKIIKIDFFAWALLAQKIRPIRILRRNVQLKSAFFSELDIDYIEIKNENLK